MQLDKQGQKEYLSRVKSEMPKTKHLSTMIRAFITGGIICCVGQTISLVIKHFFPSFDDDTIGGFTTMSMILITCILTGFGIYDKIGSFGGAGSVIPITGFANSIVSPAIEHKREGIVLGLCANMFSVAGPVIVFGITASIFVGIIYLFI